MRGVSFGTLLGLSDDFRRDSFATGLHAYFLQKKYPHAEISFSVPRIRAFLSPTPEAFSVSGISERALLQVMLAYRLFLPFAGLTISTRERAGFRDHVLGLCATKVSAGVLVGVGGHALEAKGDEQFDVTDSRSVEEIRKMLLERGLWPVYTDYIAV
jgi:2-iminoacetate synthase